MLLEVRCWSSQHQPRFYTSHGANPLRRAHALTGIRKFPNRHHPTVSVQPLWLVPLWLTQARRRLRKALPLQVFRLVQTEPDASTQAWPQRALAKTKQMVHFLLLHRLFLNMCLH